MLVFWSVCDDACQWVLNALKFVEICLWDARVKWIAVVKFAGDKWICKCCGCRKRKKMTNSTDVSDVEVTRFRQRVDLIRERHVRVKDEAKIANTQRTWWICNQHYKDGSLNQRPHPCNLFDTPWPFFSVYCKTINSMPGFHFRNISKSSVSATKPDRLHTATI